MDARELHIVLAEEESAQDAAQRVLDYLEAGEINLPVLIALALNQCFHESDVSDAVAEPDLQQRCRNLLDGEQGNGAGGGA